MEVFAGKGVIDRLGRQLAVRDVGDGDRVLAAELRVRAADGRVAGYAGCNRYTGSFKRDGKALSFGPAAATRRMCIEPEGVMEQEQQFLKAELAKPMQTGELLAAAKGKPELAAQLYGASLLAIEVDTPAEKQYLSQLAQGLGLEPAVVQSLHQSVGL